MSENIILADESLIKTQLDDPYYTYLFEGQNGKHRIRELFRQKGLFYKETSMGVQLLKKLRLSNAALTSQSVQAFLTTFESSCWWI